MRLPQQVTLPAATYTLIDDPTDYSHSGFSMATARIQFDVYSTNYLVAHAVANMIGTRVEQWAQAFPTRAGFKLTKRDIDEPPELERYRVMIEAQIYHD